MSDCATGEAALQAALKSRAVIEQAKGILMAVYSITEGRAFELLKWRSQETNTPLRRLALQVIDDFTAEPLVPASFRGRAEHLLLTAHLRVPTVDTDG